MKIAANEIPKKHQLLCKGCGKILDMRDISVISHGWIEGDKIVCYDDEPIEYYGSKKMGDSVFWTKDKKRVDLN